MDYKYSNCNIYNFIHYWRYIYWFNYLTNANTSNDFVVLTEDISNNINNPYV